MSIELQQEVLKRIEELADRENRTPSEVVSDALEMYSSQKKKKMSDIDTLWATIAEREGITRIATYDRRDFRSYNLATLHFLNFCRSI